MEVNSTVVVGSSSSAPVVGVLAGVVTPAASTSIVDGDSVTYTEEVLVFVEVTWIVVVTTVVEDPVPKVYVKVESVISVVSEVVSTADVSTLVGTVELVTEPVPVPTGAIVELPGTG